MADVWDTKPGTVHFGFLDDCGGDGVLEFIYVNQIKELMMLTSFACW